MPFSQAYCSPSSSFPIDLPCPILRLSTKEAKKRKMSENQQWQKIDNMIKKGKVTSLSSAANTADEGLLTSLEYPTIFTESLSINDEDHCQPLQLLHVARIFHTQILMFKWFDLRSDQFRLDVLMFGRCSSNKKLHLLPVWSRHWGPVVLFSFHQDWLNNALLILLASKFSFPPTYYSIHIEWINKYR